MMRSSFPNDAKSIKSCKTGSLTYLSPERKQATSSYML